MTPNPNLEKRIRRQFTTEYKLKILAKADACQHGEVGKLLRREKLFSSQLATWRRDLAADGGDKLTKTTPGPKASKTPEQKRIVQLERDNERLLLGIPSNHSRGKRAGSLYHSAWHMIQPTYTFNSLISLLFPNARRQKACVGSRLSVPEFSAVENILYKQ